MSAHYEALKLLRHFMSRLGCFSQARLHTMPSRKRHCSSTVYAALNILAFACYCPLSTYCSHAFAMAVALLVRGRGTESASLAPPLLTPEMITCASDLRYIQGTASAAITRCMRRTSLCCYHFQARRIMNTLKFTVFCYNKQHERNCVII